MDKRILIIDDEKDLCAILKKRLENITDFEVLIANNGKDGVALAKEARPLLIFLDIMMPEMSGYEVLRRLKKDKDTMDIPVVMLSVLDDKPSKLIASALYGEEYVTKPIEVEKLKEIIEKVLKRRGIE